MHDESPGEDCGGIWFLGFRMIVFFWREKFTFASSAKNHHQQTK
jgi:hypothetical protein